MRRSLLRYLLIVLCVAITSSAAAQAKRKYPVTMKVVAQKPNDAGRQELLIELTIEKGVHIYAHKVHAKTFKPLPTKVTITANGKVLETKCTYPRGTSFKLFEDSYFIYTGKVTIRAVIMRTKNDGPLKLQCRVSGYRDQAY